MDQKKYDDRWYALALAILLIAMLLLLQYCSQKRSVVEAEDVHPGARGPYLSLGDAVVTGFSGTFEWVGMHADSRKAVVADNLFINPDGTAARVFDLRKPGVAWDSRHWSAPVRRFVRARETGQVFGVAIDDRRYPNVYLTATSVFGLGLILPDKNDDEVPERTRYGAPEAQWMSGQFGPKGGPGSIWKIDGRTGAISKFAEIPSFDAENPGASLGNIAYDGRNKQLFVTDLSSGLISRLDMRGEVLQTFDHGREGRPSEALSPVSHDGSGARSIKDPKFDTLDPRTWGFTQAERRVWAVAVHQGRVYYSVATPAQVWSVGLDKFGRFDRDARWEADIPAWAARAQISDLGFSANGRMLAVQRAPLKPSADFKTLTDGSVAAIFRYTLEHPNSPATKGRWTLQPEEHALGFEGAHRNANGGADFGYAYDQDGRVVYSDCEGVLWATGQNLRSFKKTETGFEPDGPLRTHGIQGVPSGPVRPFNTPPLVSHITDYDDLLSNEALSGQIGGIRVYRIPCPEGSAVCRAPGVVSRRSPGALLPPVGALPPGGALPAGTPTLPVTTPPGTPPPSVPPKFPPFIPPCIPGTPGCFDPDPDPKPACMKLDGSFVCNEVTGQWEFKGVATDTVGIGVNMLRLLSLTPGISVANGPNVSMAPPPGVIALTGGSPGQTVVLDACGYDQAAALAGPYPCCRATISLSIPNEECKAR